MNRFNITCLRLCLLASLSLLVSCRTWEKAQFNGGDGVGEDQVLLIPFSEPRRSLWHGESTDGVLLTDAIKHWARRNADPDFSDGEPYEQVLRTVQELTDPKVSNSQWQRLTKGMGAKYVVYGQIDALSLTKPSKVGFLSPSISAAYKVVDLETGKTAYESPQITVEYGDGLESEMPRFEINPDPTKARLEIIRRLGEKIGKDLYGYYRE